MRVVVVVVESDEDGLECKKCCLVVDRKTLVLLF